MCQCMTKYPGASAFAFPMMMAELTMASWETIFHRTMMMAQGTCSAAEFQRMTAEKVAAVQQSMMALATGRNPAAVLAPFVTRTRANARRLRRTA
jgi:hypothetical protein